VDKYQVAIVGASGYAGIELVRWLLPHPGLELVAAAADSEVGQALSDLYPALLGQTDLRFCTVEAVLELAQTGHIQPNSANLTAVFLAVPQTVALDLAPAFLATGVAVLDLSADFRLQSPETYAQWYNHEHTATDWLPQAVYGLPELFRPQLQQQAARRLQGQLANLIACPGCYPTASALAAAPALAAGLVSSQLPVIIDALSGVSGMGRKAQMAGQFVTINEDMRAYNVGRHRHTPEIEQTLSAVAGHPVSVQFTPHLVPITRGLLATANLALQPGTTPESVAEVYAAAYAAEPFVQFLPVGQMPQTAAVRGTNLAQVGLFVDERTNQLVACCALDNLGKGAASQAIQCANILFGWPENTGLEQIGAVV